MPVKHQSKSYRTFNGIVHMNFRDCFNQQMIEETKTQARAEGYINIKVQKVCDFWRVFVAK